MAHYFVSLALPLPTPRQFSYILPDEMRQDELIGSRVLAPFGKRTLTGVIVAVDVPEIERAREILEVLDPKPTFSLSMLAFTKWIADYYLASWGETLKAALPQGMSPESVLRVQLLRAATDEELERMHRRAPRRAALLQELEKHSGELTLGYLERMVNSHNISAQIDALEELGYIEVHRRVEKEVKAKTQRALALSEKLAGDSEALKSALTELDARSPKQAVLLSHVYLHYAHNEDPLIMSEALRSTDSSVSVAEALIKKGHLRKFDAEVYRSEEPSGHSLVSKNEAAITFTLEQEHVLTKVNEALQRGRFKTFLVHGVTGSGKTLIYIRAIQQSLKQGKAALLLVPEIALTPQLIDRFRAVFGNAIAVFHSGMSTGERYDTWRAAKAGTMRIVIGTRSAVFAPLPELGIIIVDEEHEPSYKQDAPAPRYNARDAAIIRAKFDDAVILLGSATPSLESMFNARGGKYHLLEIRERADGAELPAITVIDTLEERKKRQMLGSFSSRLLDAIALRLERKESIILFQNLRGFAPRLECPECGHKPMCPNCAVTLTYHRYRSQMRCHYCGLARAVEKTCGNCGNPEMLEIGHGTQRIEQELEEILATRGLAPVIQRMDLDTTSRKGSHRKMLTMFDKGEIDILVGTQMVTKGIDFERVTLVGVVNADVQLFLPDFRAAERTYQLLTQVAGRAGRSTNKKGEVIIQSKKPKHQAILATLANSYDLFYNDELQLRRETLYPPFSRFVRIEFAGRNEDVVHQQANYFAYYLPRDHKAFSSLGPSIPSIPKLRSEYRRLVIIKDSKELDPSGQIMRQAIIHAYGLYNQKHPSSAVRITIDVDSHGFL